MIIDWHAHVYPPEETNLPEWEGRCPMVLEKFMEAHYRTGIDISILSNAAHYIRDMSDDDVFKAIRRWNDYAADIQAKNDGVVYSLTTVIPCGGPVHIKEMERAITQLGLKGVFINSSHRGQYPDDDEARPFWEKVTELDVPVMIHPPHVGFGEERMREYRLASSVGRPFDNELAIARLIVRGILEDFPTLKVVGTHLGGGICEVIGRMDYAYGMREEGYFLGSYEPMKIKHPPSHYLKRMYLDTVCYHGPAARCAIDTVGVDHIIYGSDAPPLTSLKPKAIKMIEDLHLPPEDRAKVFWKNATKLLKLPIPVQANVV